MQEWKFVLLGISGDLSKKKVLPALGQFSSQNFTDVQIDLIGYSRSKVAEKEVQKHLNKLSYNKSKIRSLKLIQGDYNNPEFFVNLLRNTSYKFKIIFYLAVPPSILLEILEHVSQFNQKNFLILTDKPFGEDLGEAEKILQKIKSAKLYEKIVFVDHYLFKTSSLLNKADLKNLQQAKDKKIKLIKVKALEQLGVRGRLGYYNQTGAIKDMQTHMFALTKLALGFLEADFELHEFQDFAVKDLRLGQYQDYLEDIGVTKSNTESYFSLEAVFNSQIKLYWESGKALPNKCTAVEILFKDGSQLIWKIDPEKYLVYTDKLASLDINLDKNNKQAYTNLFEKILADPDKDKSKLGFSPAEIYLSWWLYQEIMKFKKVKKIKVQKYTPCQYPLEFIK